MQSAEKAQEPATHSSQRQPAAERIAAPEARSAVSDQRPAALAQHELLQMIAESPHVAAQRALRDSIDNSPRMAAQRQQLRGIFVGTVQMQVEVGNEESPQGQFATLLQQTGEDRPSI